MHHSQGVTLWLYDELLYQQACWLRDTPKTRKISTAFRSAEPRRTDVNEHLGVETGRFPGDRPAGPRNLAAHASPAGRPTGVVEFVDRESGLSRSREPTRLHELDSLRALAAIGVVGWHYSSHFGAAPLPSLMTPFYRHGELLVDFFFVLSGFVLARRIGTTSAARRSRTTFANELPECIRCTS